MILEQHEGKVSAYAMFLKVAKQIQDTLKEMYGHEKNISRIFEHYEQLFTIQQGDQSVVNYYASLRGILDKLDLYQPLVLDPQK